MEKFQKESLPSKTQTLQLAPCVVSPSFLITKYSGDICQLHPIHAQQNQSFMTFVVLAPQRQGLSRIANLRQATCYSASTLMKHLAVLICVFLCASVSLPAALGGNLVQNPGFETTGWWSTKGGAGRVNINAHTGSYSMRATAGNDGAWQQIPVTPNTTYTLSAWGKIDPTLTYLMIFVKDYGGSAIGQYFTSTSYGQKSITFTPTGTSCVIGVWAWNGSGYGYADDFVLTSSSATPTPTPTATPLPTPTPTPNPTPTPTPSPALVRPQVWIAIRTDGLPGTGTQLDPYNGSTAAKFDALMSSFRYTPNLGIHLVGPGPFRTYANHTWVVRSGWVISGDGIGSTTVQMVGNVAGLHFDVDVFKSDPSISTDNVTIRDLTVDCNWAELSQTADNGANGEKNIKTGAVILWGSNNLIDHVRCINSYGSLANTGMEEFAIFLVAPRSSDGTNNVIQYCRVELPQGNHSAPFGLGGWIYSESRHLITNSKVLSCTAVGVNSGLSTGRGFASGGVALSNVKDCQIDNNTFIDCLGAAYIDTGSVDGLQVTNNTVIRGWEGVGIATSGLPRQNIQISGNNFSIQNRVVGGASYGIALSTAATNNLTINSNTISFDASGAGLPSFWGLQVSLLNTATISNNIVGIANWPVSNNATGIGLTMFNNRTPAGALIPELNNQ